MKTPKNAYLFWLLAFVGVNGVHRFYAGKTASAVVWLLTFGLLGIGQLVDLFLIPKMIESANSGHSVSTDQGGGNFAPHTTNQAQPMSEPMVKPQSDSEAA